MKELFEIQQRLKAPKNEYNEFGKFNYRSLETILSSVKPLLKELECTITFTDEVVNVGDRNYIKSTAILSNDTQSVQAVAYAQEGEHKGMSAPQYTGTASSYARKYAICSLLAIDDNADPDMLDNSNYKPKEKAKPVNENLYKEDSKLPADRLAQLEDFCLNMKEEEGVNLEALRKFYKYYKSPDKDNPNKSIIETRKYYNLSTMWNKWIANER